MAPLRDYPILPPRVGTESLARVWYAPGTMGCRFIALGLGLCLAAATARAQKIAISETRLGNAADYESVKGMTVAIDSRHLAFLATRGGKYLVVVDGKDGPTFDWILKDSIS